jgi:hypothetical protein
MSLTGETIEDTPMWRATPPSTHGCTNRTSLSEAKSPAQTPP